MLSLLKVGLSRRYDFLTTPPDPQLTALEALKIHVILLLEGLLLVSCLCCSLLLTVLK